MPDFGEKTSAPEITFARCEKAQTQSRCYLGVVMAMRTAAAIGMTAAMVVTPGLPPTIGNPGSLRAGNPKSTRSKKRSPSAVPWNHCEL
jgi:hypothetical protein